jgi:O-antigen biosynthesis protein WbqP
MPTAADAKEGIAAPARSAPRISNAQLSIGVVNSRVAIPRRARARAQLYTYVGKRTIDVVLALGILIFAFPLLSVLWAAVRLETPGPGLFWSRRVGRNGQPFHMPKFRTMTAAAPLAPREDLGASAEPFISPLGRFMRRTSLDELPQIWSILCGEMSFIGPRPLLANDAASLARHAFPDSLCAVPGITGLSQVLGRNYVTPRRKARYDAFYAKRVGWRLDAFIFRATAIAVLTNKGVM